MELHKQGVFEVRHFNGDVEIFHQTDPCCYGNENMKILTQLAITQLV